jgi:hypothetical protein
MKNSRKIDKPTSAENGYTLLEEMCGFVCSNVVTRCEELQAIETNFGQ